MSEFVLCSHQFYPASTLGLSTCLGHVPSVDTISALAKPKHLRKLQVEAIGDEGDAPWKPDPLKYERDRSRSYGARTNGILCKVAFFEWSVLSK